MDVQRGLNGRIQRFAFRQEVRVHFPQAGDGFGGVGVGEELVDGEEHAGLHDRLGVGAVAFVVLIIPAQFGVYERIVRVGIRRAVAEQRPVVQATGRVAVAQLFSPSACNASQNSRRLTPKNASSIRIM